MGSSSGAKRESLAGLFHNIARSMEECVRALNGSRRLRPATLHCEAAAECEAREEALGCDGTWDGVLCWPAALANGSTSLNCPPLKGLDPSKSVGKACHWSGLWAGRNGSVDPAAPNGWTDYSTCFTMDIAVLKILVRHCEPSGFWRGTSLLKPNGWTNFTVCMDPDVARIYEGINKENLEKAQAVARGTRKLEFVGLGLSFFSLILAVGIFACFRRLRSFRNQVHLQLMLALLMVVTVRLILYVDLVATEALGNLRTTDAINTINTMPILCESFYFLLEFFKTVAFAWMFIEGFYLHNTVVVHVFSAAEPQLWLYLLLGWGVPLSHTSLWLAVVVLLNKGTVDRCLGSYYLNTEFWILDGFRLLQLVINTFFLLNIVRVLWLKVRESTGTEYEQLKKSVKAALMLVPLLGIPNIMQTVPFTPTNENINYFAVYTYIASILYMFQGFMIAVIYCFTNREVIHVLKSTYQRYRLQHSSGDNLRRGSRAASVFYQKNGQVGRGSVGRAAAAAHNAREAEEWQRTPATPLLSAPPDPPPYAAAVAQASDPRFRPLAQPPAPNGSLSRPLSSDPPSALPSYPLADKPSQPLLAETSLGGPTDADAPISNGHAREPPDLPPLAQEEGTEDAPREPAQPAQPTEPTSPASPASLSRSDSNSRFRP